MEVEGRAGGGFPPEERSGSPTTGVDIDVGPSVSEAGSVVSEKISHALFLVKKAGSRANLATLAEGGSASGRSSGGVGSERRTNSRSSDSGTSIPLGSVVSRRTAARGVLSSVSGGRSARSESGCRVTEDTA